MSVGHVATQVSHDINCSGLFVMHLSNLSSTVCYCDLHSQRQILYSNPVSKLEVVDDMTMEGFSTAPPLR